MKLFILKLYVNLGQNEGGICPVAVHNLYFKMQYEGEKAHESAFLIYLKSK